MIIHWKYYIYIVFLIPVFITAKNISVSLPDTVASPGEIINIPIQVGGVIGRNIYSYQTEITFDSNVLQALGAISENSITTEWGEPKIKISTAGSIILSGTGASPLRENGNLIYIKFRVVGTKEGISLIHIHNFNFNTISPVIANDGHLYLRSKQKFQFTYLFNSSGWYLISLPVIPTDNSLTSLFPDALIAFLWNNTNGNYEPVTQLETGKGYWLAFVAPSSSTISGSPVNSYTGHYAPGWHMIGALYDTVDFSNPNDNPDGSILVTYRYDHSAEQYYVTNTLIPGEGYWIAAYQECDLAVSSGTLTSYPVVNELEKQSRWKNFVTKFGSTPPLPPGTTGLNISSLPIKKFTLYANYPNPFNSTTHIRFGIDKPGKVKLEIFNILGQRVVTLLNENRKPGVFEIVWDAKDTQGRKVPSGIYFYRLKVDNKTAINKMMLLK